ncbi:MAG: HD domain-containing phosphohydrolase [Actinomycetota bacterium]
MSQDLFDRIVIIMIFVFYVVLFETWLVIAPDPSWGGIELVFMTIPVLTMVILYNVWVALAVGAFLAMLYMPVVWPAVVTGNMSSIELTMRFVLMVALAFGAAIYKNFEEKRRERIRRLATRLAKKVNQQTHIIKAQQALGDNLDLSAQLEAFLYWSIRLVLARAGHIVVYDSEKKRVVYAKSGEVDDATDTPAPLRKLIKGKRTDVKQEDIDSFTNEMQVLEDSICVPLKVGKNNLGALCLTPKESQAFSEDDLNLISMLGVKAAISIENAKLHELNTQLFIDSIRALAKIINARDPLTKDHSTRVAHMADRLARHKGLHGRSLSNIVLAADLHDIGRIIIPDAILYKPGRLTKKEFEVVKQHPEVGFDLLRDVRALKDVLPGVRYHHERYDGQGYPEGLEGENIPLMARIIAVADTYEALTSDRSHRQSIPARKAEAMLKDVSGTQLDPELVDILLKIIGPTMGKSKRRVSEKAK